MNVDRYRIIAFPSYLWPNDRWDHGGNNDHDDVIQCERVISYTYLGYTLIPPSYSFPVYPVIQLSPPPQPLYLLNTVAIVTVVINNHRLTLPLRLPRQMRPKLHLRLLLLPKRLRGRKYTLLLRNRPRKLRLKMGIIRIFSGRSGSDICSSVIWLFLVVETEQVVRTRRCDLFDERASTAAANVLAEGIGEEIGLLSGCCGGDRVAGEGEKGEGG